MGSALERLARQYGASATPENPPRASALDALAAKYGAPQTSSRSGGDIDLGGDQHQPEVSSEAPGVIARTGQALGHLATHPWEFVTGPMAQLRDAMATPVEGERTSDAGQGWMEGKLGISHPSGQILHGQTRAHQLAAIGNTLANVAAPGLFKGMSAIAGPLVGGTLAGAALGAVQGRDDPLVGAITGGLFGAGGGAMGRLAAKYGAEPAPTASVEPPRTAPAATPAAPVPTALDVATAGSGERAGGIPLFTQTRAAIRQAYRSALVTPYADIEGEAPGLVDALHKAGAAQQRAAHIGERRVGQVLEGLDETQQQHFGTQLLADTFDAKAQRGFESAAELEAQHRAATPDDLRDGLAGQVARMRAQAARVGGRQQHAILADADQLHQDIEAAQTPNDLVALADRTFARPFSEAAERHAQHSATISADLPSDLRTQPWFQAALAKHHAYVGAPLTESALAAGVSPDALLDVPQSAYLRGFSEGRMNDAEIRRAMEATGAETPTDLTPRGALARFFLGERPELARLFPKGASGPRQGPLAFGAGGAPEGVPTPRGRVGLTGSAKMAQGTADAYVTDYGRVIATDARDKAVKAARNGVYRQVAAIGRPLEPGELPTPGKASLAFDDTKGLVTGDDGVARFEVSPNVAKAVKRFHAELQGPPATSATAAWRRITGALTQVQLAGMPVEATSHANTLASIIASVPGEAGAVNKTLAAVPMVGAKAAAIREMYGIDFAHPATRALENRLADAGALRIESGPQGGLLNSAHHWLFGPEGVDVRGRLVLARKFLDRMPNATDEQLREFITSKLGNYVRANSGVLVNGLQDSGLSAFARFQAARIPSSVRATVGASGLPASSAMQRAGDVASTLYRGPIGYALGATALNRAMTGHAPSDNERGHAMDVQLGYGGQGLYLVNGRAVRLSDADALAMGNDARPLFVPGATLNPVVATGLRTTGLRDVLPGLASRQGTGRIADALRDMTNTGLGALSPAVRFASVALTGRTPYLQSDGTMLKQAPDRFDKDRQEFDQIRAALSAANPATHAFLGEGGEAGGRSLGGALSQDGRTLGGPTAVAAKVAEFLMPRVLSPGIGGVQNDLSAMARDQREYQGALADYKAQIRRAGGPAAVSRIIEEAKADAARAGFDPAQVEIALTRSAAAPEAMATAKRARAVARWSARAKAAAPTAVPRTSPAKP